MSDTLPAPADDDPDFDLDRALVRLTDAGLAAALAAAIAAEDDDRVAACRAVQVSRAMKAGPAEGRGYAHPYEGRRGDEST